MEINNNVAPVTVAPVMPHEFTGTTDKPQIFDLSRLRRRAPDLSTVKAARFVFPGWEIRRIDNDKVVTEAEWDSNIAGTHAFKLVLLRKHTNSNLDLEVRFQPKTNSSYVEKSGIGIGWNITGSALCRHHPLVISTLPYMKFEALVKQAESYILRACSKFDYEVIRSPDKELRDFDVYAMHVNACLSAWRSNACIEQWTPHSLQTSAYEGA